MTDPVFIGLVHSVLASAQSALGEPEGVMNRHTERDGIRNRRTAERSLALLEMLNTKTHGNLDETERAALVDAIGRLRSALEDAASSGEALPMADGGRPLG